jgi:hypothetical protein|tara:strand:- start:17198 stop:17797 length:600 start_codon:yes stop_codon:yes gene_type:complete
MVRATVLNYDWPSVKPDVPPDNHGWFRPANAEMLSKFLNDETSCVIELGSWLGSSTRFILEHAENATVIAIDHWLGSPEHNTPLRDDVYDKLPTLYETFLVNCWEWKDRLIPVRENTKRGLTACYEAGLKPDLIYIDAGHDYESVMADITLSKKYFPDAVIVGDDWDWGFDFPVRKAACAYAEQEGKVISAYKSVWWLK